MYGVADHSQCWILKYQEVTFKGHSFVWGPPGVTEWVGDKAGTWRPESCQWCSLVGGDQWPWKQI